MYITYFKVDSLPTWKTKAWIFAYLPTTTFSRTFFLDVPDILVDGIEDTGPASLLPLGGVCKDVLPDMLS